MLTYDFIESNWQLSGTTSITIDRITVGEIKVYNSNMNIVGSNSNPAYGSACQYVSNSLGKAISTKKFLTENIKIRVRRDTSNLYSDKISYAGFEIPRGTSTNLNCNSHDWTFNTRNEDIIEIKRYDDLDPYKFVVVVNNQEVGTGRNSEAEPIIIEGALDTISEVKYEPYYSCQIDYTSEVVVRDKFNTGSQVNYNSLSFQPLKFCPQDLGTLIFSEQGLTDEKGSITDSIAKGQTLTVPAGQYWQIDYVTKYTDGMAERCTIGKVYDTNLKKCVSNVAENLVIEVPITQINIISTSTNEVSFSMVGDVKEIAERDFHVNSIDVLSDVCPVAIGEYVKGDGCYQVNVDWGKYTFEIKNGETKKLDEQITVYFQLEGSNAFNGVKKGVDYNYEFVDGESHSYFFKITFTNLFDLSLEDDFKPEILISSDSYFCYKVENKLWDLIKSGYYLKETNNIISTQTGYQEKSKPLEYGNNRVCVKLDSSILGGHSIESIPYFTLKDTTNYLSDERVSTGYYVFSNQEEADNTQIEYVYVNNTIYVNQTTSSPTSPQKQDYSSFFIVGGVILVLIMVIMLFNRK